MELYIKDDGKRTVNSVAFSTKEGNLLGIDAVYGANESYAINKYYDSIEEKINQLNKLKMEFLSDDKIMSKCGVVKRSMPI